jgi:hypothetical protein
MTTLFKIPKYPFSFETFHLVAVNDGVYSLLMP